MGSILALLLLCPPCYVQARDFYVSHDGLDKNPGTRENPFRTLARAAWQAEGGDTVILGGGIYRETLIVRHSGTEAQPLTFMAADGETVVISGADPVGNWKPYKGSILQTKVPKVLDPGFNQVFLNGRMMHQARFPNETSTDLHRPTCIKMSASDSRITSPLLTQPDGFWNGGLVIGLFGHRWTSQCAQIKDYRAGTLSLVENLVPGGRSRLCERCSRRAGCTGGMASRRRTSLFLAARWNRHDLCSCRGQAPNAMY